MRKEVKKDGTPYYAYMIAYVDDILCCGEDTANMMKAIEK